MTDPPTLHRNSPLMLVVRLAESAGFIVPTAIAWFAIRTRWQTWLGVPIDAIALTIAVLAVAGLLFEWWFTRFSVGAAGIIYRKGLLVRRAVSLGWGEVVSIQVSRSPVARLLGCSKVIIGVGSVARPTLIIEAVTPRTAAGFERDFARSRTRGHASEVVAGRDAAAAGVEVRPGDGVDLREPGAGLVDDPAKATLLYRIRPRDFLVLSVTYGQFVLVVPFLIGLYGNIADVLSLSNTPLTLPNLDLPLPLLILVMLIAAAPAAVTFGVAVAWLRFRRFEVHDRDDGYAMTGGWLSDESRQLSRAQVAGLKVQQNPLMRATGFARLRFASRQSGDRIASNIVFPAVRLSSVRSGLETQFPRYVAALYRPDAMPRPLGWAMAVFGVALLALVGVLVREAPVFLAAGWMLVTATALLVAANYSWAAASIDEQGVVSYRRGFVWVTHYALPCESVYVAESYSVSWFRGRSLGLLCLGIYDSRPVRLWVPVSEMQVFDRIVSDSTTG
ncbi:hypothetical protein BA895_00100 [Humibacillus sp. DSM 29435]|uniref:PH domain-containing protein n=1 Tax=Humibacillus sp. DSM 29435 TaxID=1869167 RepID=UPI000872C278|nr:PH domain-containing protein [Humibacillus sp. DSM 29435]OFE18658.1 hypothetical protein BA895_00100 [Humibacillus sp. DSM 29435]